MTGSGVRVPHPITILHGGGVALACNPNGQMHAEDLNGLFAGDTRVLSTYRFAIAGSEWHLLGHSRAGYATARWEFENKPFRGLEGEVPGGVLLFSLRRRLDNALHDDLVIRSFLERPLRTRFTLQLDADFADIFQVKDRSLPPRPNIRRVVQPDGLILSYTRDGFRRALHVRLSAEGQVVVGGASILFDLTLAPGAEWHCCLEAAPELDGEMLKPSADPHGPEPDPVVDASPLAIAADPLVQGPFERGRADLHSLAVPQPDAPPYVAAGVPWFLTLFGRDSLMASLLAGVDGTWMAKGALAAVGSLQATVRDDWRDAEPGKLPHELRRGELARFGAIPHTPYYGTHDTPSLYCLALWQAWRWSGDRSLLDAHLATALAGLRWCDTLGDRDGDGFQEYGTRSPEGYRNQSWKDAGDAIVDADGSQPPLPLAVVELQGYLYAARLAMAEVLAAVGEPVQAGQLLASARVLRDEVERRFWLDDVRYYAYALDGRKRLVRGIASNPAHLLWCGLAAPDRAVAVATRLLQPDMFSGWGLRTLSALNPAYNPLAYQLGSVWPHDTAIAAAGLWRYGHREEASVLIRAILDAGSAFEEERFPELFCGLDRSYGPPVPYLEANIPQAWAAAVPLTIVQLFLGLVPDAPDRRCFLSPWLPNWLPKLELKGIRVGNGTLDVVVSRSGRRTMVERVRAKGVEVLIGEVEAPLWGLPVHERAMNRPPTGV